MFTAKAGFSMSRRRFYWISAYAGGLCSINSYVEYDVFGPRGDPAATAYYKGVPSNTPYAPNTHLLLLLLNPVSSDSSAGVEYDGPVMDFADPSPLYSDVISKLS